MRTHGVSSATFDVSVVGNGAGFDYFAQHGSQPSDRDMLTSVALPTTELALQRTKLLSMQAESGQSAEEEDGAAAERSMNPEAVFQREVQETLLRTIQLAQTNNTATSKMTENAVIELNGLKIAGVSFAGISKRACFLYATSRIATALVASAWGTAAHVIQEHARGCLPLHNGIIRALLHKIYFIVVLVCRGSDVRRLRQVCPDDVDGPPGNAVCGCCKYIPSPICH